MATVEGPYSRPAFHPRYSSSDHVLSASDRHQQALRYAFGDSHAQSYTAPTSPLYQSYDNQQHLSYMTSPGYHQQTGSWEHSSQNGHYQPHTLHQQAWQAALEGMASSHTPSFDGTRSSTPLGNPNGITDLRSSSGTSSISNHAGSTSTAAPSTQPFHPYRRQPGAMKRSRSSDGNLSGTGGSAKALPVITIPSSVPSSTINSPSDTTLRTPTTADRVPERPRVESVGSADLRGSLSDKSKNGVAVRAGRIPVPKLVDVGEGLQTAQGQNARSVSMPQAPPQPLVGNDAIQRSVSTNDFGNGSAGNTYHKRQSSSTSSVGAVVRPTLGQGQPSSFNAGGSSSTPPSLVVAASATSSPLAPVVSPERPTRTADVRTSVTKDKSDTSASKGGLKGRLQRALNKNSDKEKAGNPTISSPIGESRQGGLPPSGSAPGNLPQPLGTAGRSVSNPSQSLPQPASTSQPHPGLGNRRPSNSSFAPSFIEPLNGNAGKGKRNLFSMRNASTDNISIGSTVSSASMMIRKMGALGKLARRNRCV